MSKPHVTRTYSQIHFEDLDPKRFEDLIRQLIYDYKDWQNIEATGIGGNDDGFDIRAFEKTNDTATVENTEGEEVEVVRSAEGNLWMIQVKREKVIGPKRIKTILDDVDKKNPPYGYILAASANFSKTAYDVFRAELQKKGVMEFHLWGKAELEDMLHQPKNDRILFAFFGISLVSRRKSRTTEIRSGVINKNKVVKTFGDTPRSQPVLLRDSNDTKYPYIEHYKDFKENPRWKEYTACGYHPLGLVVGMYEHFAYVDHIKKEYDVSKVVSLIYRESDTEEERELQRNVQENVKDFWEHLPKANQAHFIENGLVRFDEMMVIDDKGDSLYQFPHIFVDFSGRGPFEGYFRHLKTERGNCLLDNYKKVEIFPASFPKPKIGKLHKEKEISLERHFLHRINYGKDDFTTLYEVDGKYDFLKTCDVIGVPHPENAGGKNYIEITYKKSLKLKDYLLSNPSKEYSVQEQLGKNLGPEDIINVYEFKRVWNVRDYDA